MSRWIVRYLGCHFGWHGNIMAPDQPKMILGVHTEQDAREQSVPGWIHDQKSMIFPSKPRIINFNSHDS